MLVIAGSADRLLPSVDEAERLKNLIPGCRSMVLQGHGHAPLFDGRVDMSEIITGDPALEGIVFPEGGGDEVRVRVRMGFGCEGREGSKAEAAFTGGIVLCWWVESDKPTTLISREVTGFHRHLSDGEQSGVSSITVVSDQSGKFNLARESYCA